MTTEEKQRQTAQPPRPATISTPDVPAEGYDANGAPVAAQRDSAADDARYYRADRDRLAAELEKTKAKLKLVTGSEAVACRWLEESKEQTRVARAEAERIFAVLTEKERRLSEVEAREAKLREAMPDERIVELSRRLVAPGPKAANLSASELHEIADYIAHLDAIREPSDADDVVASLKTAALQRPDSEPKLRWQCSGCRWGFPGPWMKVCPACSREDYWSGSVDPKARPWPGPDSEKPAEKCGAPCLAFNNPEDQKRFPCINERPCPEHPTPKPAPDREPVCMFPGCTEEATRDGNCEPHMALVEDYLSQFEPPRPDPSTCQHPFILSLAPRKCETCGEREPWVHPPPSVPAPPDVCSECRAPRGPDHQCAGGRE